MSTTAAYAWVCPVYMYKYGYLWNWMLFPLVLYTALCISFAGCSIALCRIIMIIPLIARFLGPTWGPSGAGRTQVGPMLAPGTLLSGIVSITLLQTLCEMVQNAFRKWFSRVSMYLLSTFWQNPVDIISDWLSRIWCKIAQNLWGTQRCIVSIKTFQSRHTCLV